MTNLLPIRSFNLAILNTPIENPLPSDSFSRLFLNAFQYFSIIHQVSNPLVFLEKPSGGHLQMNPLGIFLKDIQTEDFDNDLKHFSKIINSFHEECKISELKEMSLRLVFYCNAIIVDGERHLLANKPLKMPKDLFGFLPDIKVHMGLRFVFNINLARYDLKIEPRFSKLEENYIDFNVIIPKPFKTEKVFEIIEEQRHFFDDNILPFLAR